MKAIVRELGTRPSVATPARLNAPQGAKALADLFAEESFADICILNIDWESIPPALVVETIGWYRDWPGEPLIHHFPVEIEDAFGRDNMDNDSLRKIVAGIRYVFEEKVEGRRRTGNRNAGDVIGEIEL